MTSFIHPAHQLECPKGIEMVGIVLEKVTGIWFQIMSWAWQQRLFVLGAGLPISFPLAYTIFLMIENLNESKNWVK